LCNIESYFNSDQKRMKDENSAISIADRKTTIKDS
jgi:hypothetical protein